MVKVCNISFTVFKYKKRYKHSCRFLIVICMLYLPQVAEEMMMIMTIPPATFMMAWSDLKEPAVSLLREREPVCAHSGLTIRTVGQSVSVFLKWTLFLGLSTCGKNYSRTLSHWHFQTSYIACNFHSFSPQDLQPGVWFHFIWAHLPSFIISTHTRLSKESCILVRCPGSNENNSSWNLKHDFFYFK